MPKLKTHLLALCLSFFVLAITGCETAENKWTTLKESVNNIDWPQFRSAENADISAAAKERQAASEAQMQDQAESRTAAASDAYSHGETCPDVSAVKDLDRLHQFSEAGTKAFSNNISSVKIIKIRNSCTFKENNILVDITITFEGTLGPQARIWESERPSFSYPYFIAITNSLGSILAKEVFTFDMSYDPNRARLVKNETIRQIIPLNGGLYKGDIDLLLGFQLTDGQLAYNRGRTAFQPVSVPDLPAGDMTGAKPGADAPVDLTAPR